MKHWLQRSAVVVFVALLLAVSLSPVLAQDTPFFTASDPIWTKTCNSVSGTVTIQANWAIPNNHTLVFRWHWESSLPGWETEYASPPWTNTTGSTINGGLEFTVDVPADGWASFQGEIYDSTNTMVALGHVQADCVTKETTIINDDIHSSPALGGVPLPLNRVLGTVNYATPLYDQAGGAALDATITAGQTWFIIGQATAEDGSLWYKLFVGSFSYPWVPAESMTPSGPVS